MGEKYINKFLISSIKDIAKAILFIIDKLFGIDTISWLKKKTEYIIDFKFKIGNYWISFFPYFLIILFVYIWLFFQKSISAVEEAGLATSWQFLGGHHKLIFYIITPLFVVLFLWSIFINNNYKKFRSMGEKGDRGYLYIGENKYEYTFISPKKVKFFVSRQLITTEEKTKLKFKFLWSGGRMPAPKQKNVTITNLSIKDNEKKEIPIQRILPPQYSRYDETTITIIPKNIIKKDTSVKVEMTWEELVAEKRIKPYYFLRARENKYSFHKEPSAKMTIQIPKDFIQIAGNNEFKYKCLKSINPRQPGRISSREEGSSDHDSIEKDFIPAENYHEIIETFSTNSEGIFKLEPNHEYDIIWEWSEYFKKNDGFGGIN